MDTFVWWCQTAVMPILQLGSRIIEVSNSLIFHLSDYSEALMISPLLRLCLQARPGRHDETY